MSLQTTFSAAFQHKAHELRASGLTPQQFANIIADLDQARTEESTPTPLADVLMRHDLGSYQGTPPTLVLTTRGRLILELTATPL